MPAEGNRDAGKDAVRLSDSRTSGGSLGGSVRRGLGTLLLDKPPLGWPLIIPSLARRRWQGFHNRTEKLLTGPGHRGFRCDWEWTSELNLAKSFPVLAGRTLLRAAFADWPIHLADELPSGVGGEPKVSFVVGHRGEERLPLLLSTLRSLLGQRGCPVEVIVVEQAVEPLLRSRLPPGVRWVHQKPSNPTAPYSRSWAFNEGARQARGRVLVLHDNDMLAPADYASEVLRLAAEGYEAASVMRFLFYLDEVTTARLLGRPGCGPMQLRDVVPARVQQNSQGGTIAITREAYFRIGGHDESFLGWGGEDNEFWDRCRTLRFFWWSYLPFIHLWHAQQPDKPSPVERTERLRRALGIDREERVRRLADGQSGEKWKNAPRSGSAQEGPRPGDEWREGETQKMENLGSSPECRPLVR